ncbi:AraC family transcriptional regulator [Pedobacter sp. HDW13]|uniref:helix-turn-helix domain-containing protein n=1 Tax=Pedobacter sp. HDW13 TaxID=2714940 RepID=UPI001407FA94|nr:helix-turn-helix domain-containing protein [Pedobacter sp. HDW13]QIL41554.1 AraC family transcriptional regulator [Pedobacter sp. HDW13]
MQHHEFEAPETLRDTIRCFWYNKRESVAAETFEVLPDGYAEIIFHFGNSCSTFQDGVLQPLPSPFMMGLLNQPITFHAQNCLEIIAIRCYPWTVFDLLGLPSAKQHLHVLEHPIAHLHPILDTHIRNSRIEEAINEVEQYFIKAKSQIAANSLLFKAGIAMREAKGTLPVSQVAAAAHTTVRTLERKFKQSSGYTVKDVLGLMRFEQVRNHLWIHPDANLSGLAYQLGYTDQSHLSREFKHYSGTTPAAFARKAKHGKTVIKGDFVAFVQA